MNSSDNLLRTFASVPPKSRVLDLGCKGGLHTAPLHALGFDLHACDVDEESVAATRALLGEADVEGEPSGRRVARIPGLASLGYPDAFFDWVVAYDLPDAVASHKEFIETLREVRRVLAPGGWLYLAVHAIPANFNPLTESAGFASDSGPSFAFTEDTLNALAEEAGLAVAEMPKYLETDRPRLEAVYRRVDAETIR